MLLKRNIKKFYFGFLLFIVFSFADFYFFGIGRPSDYLFLVGLSVYCCLVRIKASRQAFSSIYLLVILSIWLAAGMLNQNVLGALVLLVGIGFVYFFFNRTDFSIPSTSIDQAIKITIIFNVLVLLIQMLVFYRFEHYLDLHAMLGSIASRGLGGGMERFRPSGLFQEPNTYCAVLFCLLSLRLLSFKSRSYVDYLGLVSMILTKSLWGFGAAFILIWFMFSSRWIVLLLLSVCSTAYFFIPDINSFITDLSANSAIMSRVMNIGDDGSWIARYGSWNNIEADQFLVIGHGIDTNNFAAIGTNTYAFLLYCLGIAGITLLLVWGKFIQKIPLKHAFFIAFLFTTYPLFSYMYFWVWLGLLLGFKDIDKRTHHEKILSIPIPPAEQSWLQPKT